MLRISLAFVYAITVNALRPAHETIALASVRRPAAYRALSTIQLSDEMAPILAGTDFIKDVKQELNEIGRVCGMRTVYNVMESGCVTENWIDSNINRLLKTYSHIDQVVIFKAGMSTLAYRLESLKRCQVYELDSANVSFMKKHLIESSHKKVRMYAHWDYLCPCPIDDHNVQNDFWLDSLDDYGWLQSQPSVFVMQDVVDQLQIQSVEHILKSVLHRTMHGSAVVFNTGRMMDERRRMENWLTELGFDVFSIDELADKKIHGGVLSTCDSGFKNKWLISCET